MELGRPPTNEEILEHSGLSADRFRDIVRTNMRVGSLHERDRITGQEVVENLVDSEDASTAVANNTAMLRYGMDDVVCISFLFFASAVHASLCLLQMECLAV